MFAEHYSTALFYFSYIPPEPGPPLTGSANATAMLPNEPMKLFKIKGRLMDVIVDADVAMIDPAITIKRTTRATVFALTRFHLLLKEQI